MNETAAEWYHRRAEAFIAETVGLMPSNIDAFRNPLITVDRHTIVITSAYPIVRGVIERWATDGEPPPAPYDSIRVQPLSKRTQGKPSAG